MRILVWLGSALAALVIVVAAVLGLRPTAPPAATPPAPQAAKSIAPPAARAKPPAAPLPTPSFDVVTVDPHGQAVIAGRAAPGDRVRILDGDRQLGEITADARGEWVLVPSGPMVPGSHQLSLEATGRDGGAARRSGDVVALSVAAQPEVAQAGAAVAVLLPSDAAKPVRVLQAPASSGDAQPPLSVAAAEYDSGQLKLAGHAEPGARLNIYAGDRLLGTATSDAAGQWSLAAAAPQLKPGSELRVDELAADGAVIRRAAAPFEPGTPPGIYTVQRGNSLWVIARQLYGNGTRYVAIYDANRGQIRDPDRIYPGQQFKTPPL